MVKSIKNCFGTTNINLCHQVEMDIAKGIAILLMVFANVSETLAWLFDPMESITVSKGICEYFLGGSFAGPVFLFCMGISLCYSRKSTPKALTKRSLNLLGIIILLELFRTLIPGLIEWFITKDPETIEYLYDSLCVDILNFAMLSLLVIALFKKLKLKPIVMFIIACVFSIAGQLLQNVSTGVYFLDVICGYIWLTYDLSFFPLLNFFIFLVSGYIFGQAWIKIKDKETFFKITTPICWGITLIYYISMAVVKEWYYFSNGYFYGIGFIDSIFTLIICLGMIGLGYYLHRLFKDKINFLASMGSRVTSFYCIHWVIISMLFLVCLIIIGDSYLPQWSIIPVSIITIILSYIISLKYKEIKLKQQNFK